MMIEIKIPTSAAVIMLTERMRYELQLRIKAGCFEPGYEIENLSSSDLLSIAETSAFDLVFLLPVDILIEESNLPEIITEAFHALSKIFGREEFTIYTKERAEILLNKVKNTFNQIEPNQNYFPN
jgi:hypothetical protein